MIHELTYLVYKYSVINIGNELTSKFYYNDGSFPVFGINGEHDESFSGCGLFGINGEHTCISLLRELQ